ncbi:DUF4158 domain-containing protein [Streptomyces sp. NPDC014724]|uniref:DUF4158 domain-containing protein n=1 Tax=unclassified Streptomyces TaxID=2593676 RepID=UPI00370134C5
MGTLRRTVPVRAGATRLGFSLLLKFFEMEGRFPDVLEEVPSAAVEYVADLVKVPAIHFAKYTLVGRTAEYHRKQIREALGFRPSTVADEKALAEWPAVEVCPVELVEDRQHEALLLNDVRKLGLPDGLFADCSEKLVAAWRARAIKIGRRRQRQGRAHPLRAVRPGRPARRGPSPRDLRRGRRPLAKPGG